MKSLLILAFAFFPLSSSAGVPDLSLFCHHLLQKQPSLPEGTELFTTDFRKAVTPDQLKAIFSTLYQETGACRSYTVTPTSTQTLLLSLVTESRLQVRMTLHKDSASNLLDGLSLTGVDDPSLQISNWNDVVRALSTFDSSGKLSATLVSDDSSTRFVHNSSEAMAVGSTFKLYILGALEQTIRSGKHQWAQVLPLKEDWKSLPSGIMHDWEAGKPVTLFEYAEKMISISDNTATDHLLFYLGRENVSNMLVAMGNTHQQAYLPLLSTLEMFKLKWAVPSTSTDSYILMNVSERQAALEKLKSVSRQQVGTNGVSLLKPGHIDTLEWFATTEENCKAMFWLASRNSPEVRAILSKSVLGLSNVNTPQSHWSYAGYKGGSEAGVLSMTYLLESKKGQRACLSLTWNNKSNPVSLYRMTDLVGKILRFSESVIR